MSAASCSLLRRADALVRACNQGRDGHAAARSELGRRCADAPGSLWKMERRLLSGAHKELLVVLLRADRRARTKSESGKGDTFAWHSSGGMGPTLLMHRGAEDGQEV